MLSATVGDYIFESLIFSHYAQHLYNEHYHTATSCRPQLEFRRNVHVIHRVSLLFSFPFIDPVSKTSDPITVPSFRQKKLNKSHNMAD